MPNLNQTIDRSLQISRSVASLYSRRVREATDAYVAHVRKAQAEYLEASAAPRYMPQQALRDWTEYATDFTQRSILFWDTLRQRGNNWICTRCQSHPSRVTLNNPAGLPSSSTTRAHSKRYATRSRCSRSDTTSPEPS